MANPLRQLAGETAVYGLSSILARVLNFLFVPLYTRLLTQAQYGTVAEFMAYIAFLQVVFSLGLETGCFRFANKNGEDPQRVYAGALLAVLVPGVLLLTATLAFGPGIAAAMGYAGYGRCIAYVGFILFSDSLTAILFAKLRQEHRAVRFAVLKSVKILTETGVNLLLFLVFPARPDFSYPLLAICASCAVCLLMLLPELLRIRALPQWGLLRRMLGYSLPLMVAALPGISNEVLDRFLFRWLDTSSEAWRASLGVYQAAVKLAVIMNLFIQMFRYAAEPFFFQRAGEKDARTLYAQVMEGFTAFCIMVLLGVSAYVDLFSLALGRDFRAGVDIVPVMLLAYMLLGMQFNVSMWYKLSGHTHVAIWVTATGLAVTAAVNVAFMPRFSYHASAFAHLASSLAMLLLCAIWGRRKYPIPYRWGRILGMMAVMGVALAGLYGVRQGGFALPSRLALNTGILVAAALGLFPFFSHFALAQKLRRHDP